MDVPKQAATMSHNLENYIMVFKGFIEPEVCKDTCSELDKVDWVQHSFYNANTGAYHSHEKELSVFFHHVSTKELLMKKNFEALQAYVKHLNFPWFDGWTGYSDIRFNRYLPNTQMALHCDHIHDMFDGQRKGIPILSIVGNLNDDYTGAEFVMWDQVIPLGKGDLMIFPSNFMYPHYVKDCIKGTRYSFVSWVW
jgi:predicted 2-oxoglutarate/Fe(II)-dependent dioxygenase YbiX